MDNISIDASYQQLLEKIQELPPFDFLGAVLFMKGTQRLVRPSFEISLEARLETFKANMEASLRELLLHSKAGKAWQTCYAIIVEFDNGAISFIDVGGADDLIEFDSSENNTLFIRPLFDAFVEAESGSSQWPLWISLHRDTRQAAGMVDFVWKSAIVVFATRIGVNAIAGSTRRIYSAQTQSELASHEQSTDRTAAQGDP